MDFGGVGEGKVNTHSLHPSYQSNRWWQVNGPLSASRMEDSFRERSEVDAYDRPPCYSCFIAFSFYSVRTFPQILVFLRFVRHALGLSSETKPSQSYLAHPADWHELPREHAGQS